MNTTTILATQRFTKRPMVRKFMDRHFPASCEYIFCKTKMNGSWKFFPIVTNIGVYTSFDFTRLGVQVDETIETV